MQDAMNQARAHFTQGITHYQAGRVAEAEAAFRAALALAPGRPSVLTNLASVLVRQSRLGEAVPLLEQASAAEPDNAATWSQLGTACAMLGDAAGGLAALDRALALDDQRADDWSRRGSLLREMGRLDDAALCFERALALGADTQLNSYYLAGTRGQQVAGTDHAASRPPRQYVEDLFDAYANAFSAHLVSDLRYQAHSTLVRGLDGLEPLRFACVLDLGCGTGLCGELLAARSAAIDGVDLSQRMLDQARSCGAYRRLFHADVVQHLQADEGGRDLVLAADVFIYVGVLEQVFAGAARALKPGGWFAFSVERAGDDQGVLLRPSLRYAHAEPYLRALAAQHGFDWHHAQRAPIREEQRVPIDGLYVYLRRA